MRLRTHSISGASQAVRDTFLFAMPPRDRQGRRHVAVPETVVPAQTSEFRNAEARVEPDQKEGPIPPLVASAKALSDSDYFLWAQRPASTHSSSRASPESDLFSRRSDSQVRPDRASPMTSVSYAGCAAPLVPSHPWSVSSTIFSSIAAVRTSWRKRCMEYGVWAAIYCSFIWYGSGSRST